MVLGGRGRKDLLLPTGPNLKDKKINKFRKKRKCHQKKKTTMKNYNLKKESK